MTLGEEGQIHVTQTAARRYASQVSVLRDRAAMQDEEARRELTELLLDAKPGAAAGHYRARSRSTQLDVSVTVAREGRLLIVTSVNVRDYR